MSASGLWGFWVFFKGGKKVGASRGPLVSLPLVYQCLRWLGVIKGPSKLVENVKIINLVILPPEAVCEAASACVQ